MFLELITLLFVVASPLLVAWYIRVIVIQEANRVMIRQDRVATRVDKLADEITKASRLIVASQSSLDRKFDALSNLVDTVSTNVTWEYQNLNALAKSDVVASRREELHRSKELKVALERLMGVALTSRQPPAQNDVIALEILERRIKELETILREGVSSVH